MDQYPRCGGDWKPHKKRQAAKGLKCPHGHLHMLLPVGVWDGELSDGQFGNMAPPS